eukprot:scpid79939/ scgid3040/ 
MLRTPRQASQLTVLTLTQARSYKLDMPAAVEEAEGDLQDVAVEDEVAESLLSLRTEMQFLDVDVVQRTIADEDADEEQLRIISQRQDTMTSMLMDLVSFLSSTLATTLVCSSPKIFKTCELDFFKLYFTEDIVARIVEYTNSYAREHIGEKRSYAVQGEWVDTTNEEIYCLFALLFHMAFNRLPEIRQFWSEESLFRGNYARSMVSTCVSPSHSPLLMTTRAWGVLTCLINTLRLTVH